MKRYVPAIDGEEFEVKSYWKMACCECNLVHLVKFRVDKKGRIFITAWRDNRATAAKRRCAKLKPNP